MSQAGGPRAAASRGARSLVLVAGGTGLVGRALVERLASGAEAPHVIALARRAIAGLPAGVDPLVVDFGALDRQPPLAGLEAACCALGTTLATAGSQEAFRRVDFEAVVGVAALARRSGARRFVLLSSVGADAASRTFYLRVKGEAEDAIRQLGFARLDILRPGLLIGTRTQSRPGERVAQAIAPLTDAVMLGPLRRYRSIAATRVAEAMIGALRQSLPAGPPAAFVHEHDALMVLAGASSAPSAS